MRKILVCPKCKDQLVSEEKVLKCHQGHSFDIAKQGYVNLVLGNAKGSGDDKVDVKVKVLFFAVLPVKSSYK